MKWPTWIIVRWPERFLGRWVLVTLRDGTVLRGRIAGVRRGPDGDKQLKLVDE